MTRSIYAKLLSANDIGATGAHQGGMAVPKADRELLAFFPKLDPAKKNPSAWILCEDEYGKVWKMRFVYYNNKLHDPEGTRNEYRITWMTKYLKDSMARVGDSVVFKAKSQMGYYAISIQHSETREKSVSDIIKLSGWRKVH